MSSSNLEILAYEPTPLGDLCLRRRELLSRPGTVITEIAPLAAHARRNHPAAGPPQGLEIAALLGRGAKTQPVSPILHSPRCRRDAGGDPDGPAC